MKINTLEEYTDYIHEVLRNVTTKSEHYTDSILNETFFKSNIVDAAKMLLLKKATNQIKNIA